MTTSYNLYDFLADCEGNWRNAIFIDCACCPIRCVNRERGALLIADAHGHPRVVTTSKFETVTGQIIDPGECLGKISKPAFESVFRRFLLWELSDPDVCTLCALDTQVVVVPPTKYIDLPKPTSKKELKFL